MPRPGRRVLAVRGALVDLALVLEQRAARRDDDVVRVVERGRRRVGPERVVRRHGRPAGQVPVDPVVARPFLVVDGTERRVVEVDARTAGPRGDVDRVLVAVRVVLVVLGRVRVVVRPVGIAGGPVRALRLAGGPEEAGVVAVGAERAAHRHRQRVLGGRDPGHPHGAHPDDPQEVGLEVLGHRDVQPAVRLEVHRRADRGAGGGRIAVLGRLGLGLARGRGEVTGHVRHAGQRRGLGGVLDVERGIPQVADVDHDRQHPEQETGRHREHHEDLAGPAQVPSVAFVPSSGPVGRVAPAAPAGPARCEPVRHGVGSRCMTVVSTIGIVVYGGLPPKNRPSSWPSGVVGWKS